MCLIHQTPADGPEDTLDGEMPDSWLTADQLLAKFDRLFGQGRVFVLCNELKDGEIDIALENIKEDMDELLRKRNLA